MKMKGIISEKPKYWEIKEEIKEDILKGKIERLSESRIIHQFKVSSTTARRVLNDLEEEGLLERVVGKGSIVIYPSRKKVKELGVIFFDIFDPNQPFISEIVEGIEEKSKDKGYHLHLYTTRKSPISENHHSSLYHLIVRRKIDGIFILSPISKIDIKFIKKERIPFVVIGNRYDEPEVPTVIFDYEGCIKKVCNILIRKGYKKIGIITGIREEDGIKRSGYFCLKGYKEFLNREGIDYEEVLIKEKENVEEEGYKGMEEFYLLNEKDRPEAIITTSSNLSKGAMKFLKEREGWDVLIIPITDKEIEHSIYVKCSYKEIGKVSFEILEKQIIGDKVKKEITKVSLGIVKKSHKMGKGGRIWKKGKGLLL